MPLPVLTVDDDVIQVGSGVCGVRSEDFVHEALKGSGRPDIGWLTALLGMSPHPRVHTSPEPCSSYPMPRAELGFDGSRSGYILNPPKPNKYPPP